MVKLLLIIFSIAAAQAMINDDFDLFKVSFLYNQTRICCFDKTICFLSNKKKYKKVYKNAKEEIKARITLKAAKKDIDEHNILYAKGKATFKRALWEKSDMSREDRVNLLNRFRIPPKEYADFVVRPRQVIATSAVYPTGPESYNADDLGLVTPVKDQGDCGSKL